MSENRPRSPDRKLGLVAPVSIAIVVALIVLGAVLFRGRSQDEPAPVPTPMPEPVAAPPAPAPKTTLPAIPPPEAALNRRDLLAEADAAAATYTANSAPARSGGDPTLGRRFSLRIPFGCEGPQVRPGAAAQAFYEYDPEKRTIRLVARPAVWTTLPMIQDLKAPGIESVEGFWIPHPWTYSETCPARRERPPPAAPAPPAAQTLGIAQLFEKGGSRVQRRGDRPYEYVMKLGEGERPPQTEGFRLVIEGRLGAFPNGRVTTCWSESPDHRPICLFAAQIDRVAFEAGGSGRMFAEWRY